MSNVLIRNVPDDVHSVLARRAEAAGQSLQQYLLSELTRLTQKPTMAEMMERINANTGGRIGLDEAVQSLRELRDER